VRWRFVGSRRLEGKERESEMGRELKIRKWDLVYCREDRDGKWDLIDNQKQMKQSD